MHDRPAFQLKCLIHLNLILSPAERKRGFVITAKRKNADKKDFLREFNAVLRSIVRENKANRFIVSINADIEPDKVRAVVFTVRQFIDLAAACMR